MHPIPEALDSRLRGNDGCQRINRTATPTPAAASTAPTRNTLPSPAACASIPPKGPDEAIATSW
ncbi:MAG: hypothetical protein K0R58_4301, partial [Ramlibacter sp.]|nr:hypothetical protein [Ramlibacter sp.]